MSNKNPTLLEALNEFYKLKEKYDKSYYEKYVKPIVKSKGKSKREKRVEYSKLPKAECINCKRNVGTIFSITSAENKDSRHFIAKCGDLQDPCPLDINFNYGNRFTYESLMNSDLNDINNIKTKIIVEKNNLMFAYTPKEKAVKIFDELTEDLKFASALAEATLDSYMFKNQNMENNALLNKLENDFGISSLLPFKEMVSDYNKTNNIPVITEAVTFYVNEMVPQLDKIQNLKYSVDFVEYDSDEDVYNLIQYKNSLFDLENGWGGEDKLNAFVKGTKKVPKNKTLKATPATQSTQPNKPNRKTRKLASTLELVEVEEPEEQKEEEQEQEQEEVQEEQEEVQEEQEQEQEAEAGM
jgi:hypothetical protein